MTAGAAGASDGARANAKVFISYSRQDLAFANRLVAALEARGFAPQIDREEIYAFEDWWKRIEALVVETDTIVFVLSPDAVASDVCRREVAFAASLNKRFAPIVCRPVADASIPESLARLNFVFFTDDALFEQSADKLADAMSTDIGWVRKHTEFGAQALRWSQAGMPGPRGLLLRSPMLEEAEHWIATRPASGPSPTEATQAFIAESRRATSRRRNMLSLSLGAGAAIALVLAGIAFWQRGVAVEKERLAAQQRDAALITQSRLLADRATRATASGDAVTGMLLALAALPDEHGAPRPYVPAAELALFDSSQQRLEIVRLVGHDDAVESAAFSPDGRRIVTASDDKTARIWDAATGAQVAVLKGHDDKVRSAIFSPDGRHVVTASYDNTARIWDAATGAQISVLKYSDWVLSVAFSPDGRRVAIGSAKYGMAQIWDVATGTPVVRLAGEYGAITGIAFSPDGKRVVGASQSKTVLIWDAGTGTKLAELTGHEDEVNSAAFSPDGRLVVSASEDKTARIWDAATGAQVATLEGHEQAVTSVAFSADGRRVVTASKDRTVRLWDTATHAQLAVLRGHEAVVQSAAFSPDGKRIVSASDDKTARIWDVAAATRITPLQGGEVARVTFSPDGRRMMTIDAGGRMVHIRDVGTGASIAVLRDDAAHAANASDAAFSADGRRIVTAGIDNTVRSWDATTGALIAVLRPRDGRQALVVVSPGGGRVASLSYPDAVAIWDSESGATIEIKRVGGRVNAVAFSPDGKRVVTASVDTMARIFDAATGALIMELRGHEGQVESAAFSPDGRRVVTGSYDATARIWDAATGAQIAVLPGHAAVVTKAAFSPNGQRVMTVSTTGIVRVWDAATAAQIAVLKQGAKPELITQISAIRFSPDGRSVLTFSWADGTAMMRTWPIFPTTQDLVDSAERDVPRCLTRQQLDDAFLDPAPADWCIEMEKWPYHTQDWKDWLGYKRADNDPPMPDTPAWPSWVAAHKAK